mmetsp:Transcript_13700/g.33738  ORF Transcript_13700/g.33738 Transcript_13700/m.33738 type:complete len:966 (+) Transcript_13700:74-2971(+)
MPAREDSGTFYRGSIRDVLTQMSGGPQAPRDPSASPASSCNSSASVEGADFPVDSGGGGHSSEEEEDDECASDTSARLRDVDRRLAANASEVGRGSSKWDWLREADTYKQDPSTPDASPGYVDDGDEEYNDDSDDEGRNERGAAEEDGGRFAFGGEQAFRDEAHSSEEDSGAKKRVPKAPSQSPAQLENDFGGRGTEQPAHVLRNPLERAATSCMEQEMAVSPSRIGVLVVPEKLSEAPPAASSASLSKVVVRSNATGGRGGAATSSAAASAASAAAREKWQNRTELFAFSPGKRLPKPQAVISPRSLYKLNTSWSPVITRGGTSRAGTRKIDPELLSPQHSPVRGSQNNAQKTAANPQLKGTTREVAGKKPSPAHGILHSSVEHEDDTPSCRGSVSPTGASCVLPQKPRVTPPRKQEQPRNRERPQHGYSLRDSGDHTPAHPSRHHPTAASSSSASTTALTTRRTNTANTSLYTLSTAALDEPSSSSKCAASSLPLTPSSGSTPRSCYSLQPSAKTSGRSRDHQELTSRVAAVQPRPPRSRVAKVKLCVCAQTASLLARERTRLLKDEQEFFKELVHFQARERDLNSVCEQLENSKRRFQQEKVSEWEAKEKHVDDLRAEMAELERRLDEVERESKKCAAAMQERRRQMKSWEKQLCWKEAELEKKIAISGEEKAKELAQWDQKMEDLRGRREKLVKGGVLSEGGSDLAATVTKLESAVEEKRVCTSSRRAVLRPERDRARAAQAKIKALQEELKSLEAQKAHDSKRKSDVVAATNKLRAVVAMLTHKADDEINPQIARETEVLADWHNKLATLRGENDELEQTLVMRTRRIEERFLQRKAEAEAAQLLSGRESLADGGEDERELRVTMAELNIASLKESHAALQRAILAFQECCLADADPDRSTKVKASSSVGGRGRSSMSRMSSGRAPTSRTPTTSSGTASTAATANLASARRTAASEARAQ